MTTLAEALEYLDLEQEDAENVSDFIAENGPGLYGINFHGAVMPYKPEQATLQEIYDGEREYYEEFTLPEDYARGFITGEMDVFFEITKI